MDEPTIVRLLMQVMIEKIEAFIATHHGSPDRVAWCFIRAEADREDAGIGAMSIPDEGLFDWIVGYAHLYPENKAEVDRILCQMSARHRMVTDRDLRIKIISQMEEHAPTLEAHYGTPERGRRRDDITDKKTLAGAKFDIVSAAYRRFATGGK